MARRMSIKYEVKIRTGVINQRDEPSCSDIALADMLTIISLLTGGDLVYDQTPQIGIDRQGNLGESIKMCILPQYGLEEVTVYPFSKLPRDIGKKEEEVIWEEEYYETPCEERFRLQDISWIEYREWVIPNLLNMFKEGGFRYPVVGLMVMGLFKHADTALYHADENNLPFHHDPALPEPKGVQHALLIVGIDTTSLDEREHYCIVKNSYGEEWGNKGYSRVGLEVFVEILYPTHPRC